MLEAVKHWGVNSDVAIFVYAGLIFCRRREVPRWSDFDSLVAERGQLDLSRIGGGANYFQLHHYRQEMRANRNRRGETLAPIRRC